MVCSPYFRVFRSHLGLFLSKVYTSLLLMPSTCLTPLFVRDYTRADVPPEEERMDIFDSGYAGKIFLYIFCGVLDAMWQTTAYWIMGAMSNDPAKLAYFAGFCTQLFFIIPDNTSPLVSLFPDKSIQSAGAAGVWRADAVKLP
jgi:hypothetical protein